MTISSDGSATRRHVHAAETHCMSAMPRSASEWTLEQLHRLPDDGNRYELVDGGLFVTPPPSVAHEELVAVLAKVLHPYVARWRLGRIYTPHSVIQARGSQAEPDLMVRHPTITDDWSALTVPIFVAEVASRSTRRRDLGPKRRYYLDLAIPDYWIIDGTTRTIRVVRPGHADVVANDEVIWYPAGSAEPLHVDVAEYFREALGEHR